MKSENDNLRDWENSKMRTVYDHLAESKIKNVIAK